MAKTNNNLLTSKKMDISVMNIVDKVAIHNPPCEIVDNFDSIAVIK